MPEPTHATLATFQMDPARGAEQRQALERFIVPGVRRAPGFVTGCWTHDAQSEQSVALVTFTSAELAEAFAGSVRGNAAAQEALGVELLSIRVVEVTATA